MNDEHKELTFIESVDEELHDNILRLDQKLKGLQAEITAKIDSLAYEKDQSAQQRKEQLLALSDEVSKAINGIKRLVNLVVSEDFTPEEFNEMNEESLDALREVFKDSVDQISKIKEKF
ncbi:hypothetical protein [Legionella jordanis]|uniref:Coiled-coil protein n=1 Tax=Legionella jordanis TaxID=456 RepID=A0A0W0VBP5_9GAMM|nr:hypothetical protein [Legionella jordanis]KTD17554.1 hypothetical protein Ljor_1860 [Legionella jordanis]RMX05110.1 hypothetical protein EAW55_00125 [Legionella jordanis]RMX17366.1 hypothetical protein EAS68_10755 [Legionella jordanis]VEH13523.1 Uncharacterised protein [Legionella jordanis]HAT8714439.1 hypothetical protein [Legionella jordanis]